MPKSKCPEGFRDIFHFAEALDREEHPDHARAKAHAVDGGQWWPCEDCGRDYLDVRCTTFYMLEDLGAEGFDDDDVLRRLTFALAAVDPGCFDADFPGHETTHRCGRCERKEQLGSQFAEEET
jgi:hypothetical protein